MQLLKKTDIAAQLICIFFFEKKSFITKISLQMVEELCPWLFVLSLFMQRVILYAQSCFLKI